jgi:uncharacterized membrane protein
MAANGRAHRMLAPTMLVGSVDRRAWVGFEDVMHVTVLLVEGVGVAVLAGGVLVVGLLAIVLLARGRPLEQVYGDTRQRLGRVLLLGIEVLVAGDIIRTVAIDLTLTAVAELAGIVIIRTFLSWTIELETEGRWPWRKSEGDV